MAAEQSACVACQQPCIDIDAERTYWARLPTPAFAFERYGYVGLVVGYFLYYYLYAGNWDYYFSGVWQRQSDQLALLLRPGFFLFGQPIDVPRLVAVPLFLGVCTWLGVLVGRGIESGLRGRVRRRGAEPDRDRIRHRVFLVATYLVFNFFFLFSGRPLILLLPAWVQYLYDVILVALSTLWLYRAWGRSPALYGRENLAERFRKQLARWISTWAATWTAAPSPTWAPRRSTCWPRCCRASPARNGWRPTRAWCGRPSRRVSSMPPAAWRCSSRCASRSASATTSTASCWRSWAWRIPACSIPTAAAAWRIRSASAAIANRWSG